MKMPHDSAFPWPLQGHPNGARALLEVDECTSVCKALDEEDSSALQWMRKQLKHMNLLKWQREVSNMQVVDAASSGEESTSAGTSDALRVGAISGTVHERSVSWHYFD